MGKVLKTTDTVMAVTAIGVEAAIISKNAYKDYELGTTRNTTTAVASTVGAWGGSLGGIFLYFDHIDGYSKLILITGSTVGAVIGTIIFPVFGTVLGGLLGGAAGAIAGVKGTNATVSTIGDLFRYDMVTYRCQKCDAPFICRKYTIQSREECEYNSCKLVHSLNYTFNIFEN